MLLVLGREHLSEAKRRFRERNVHMIGEPGGRNTAPCIGLGALYARCRQHEGAAAFLPADHFIGDVPAFLDALRKAAMIAEAGGIATLGIVPTRPETGYGYIRRGKPYYHPGVDTAYRVSSFVEKPDLRNAEKYLSSGEYFWNAGIFVATPEAILSEIQKYLPDLYEGLKWLEGVMGTNEMEARLEAVYGTLAPVSFDYGIMERTREPVFMVPCQCGWSDVGSWSSLYELRERDRDRDLNVSEGECLLIDCRDSYVSAQSGRVVACLGLRHCLVVDTPDALLVSDLEKSQEIRKIVAELMRRNRGDLL
jgi:mannose-1-phosphate guanylyltransferase